MENSLASIFEDFSCFEIIMLLLLGMLFGAVVELLVFGILAFILMSFLLARFTFVLSFPNNSS